MDTLAHGLWGGAAFGQGKESPWKWAFWLGMAPDLFSFGPFFLTHIGDIGERWSKHRFGPPDPLSIPSYVYHAYDVTHSLVIWSALFVVTWKVSGRPFWPLAAWALHILCDIPTHSTRFFPTPYLWPFQTPFVNGMRWARMSFMLTNYSLLTLTYIFIYSYRKWSKTSSDK